MTAVAAGSGGACRCVGGGLGGVERGTGNDAGDARGSNGEGDNPEFSRTTAHPFADPSAMGRQGQRQV
jgi:hypothetical protein